MAPTFSPRPPNGKIICVGRNFGAHAIELGNPIPEWPVIFLKPESAVIGPGEPIVLPEQSNEVHHEGEMALVVGEPLSHATPEEALQAIAGWTLLNDVTARDLQRADKGRFTRAKGFDTFCPISDTLVSGLDWSACEVSCAVNGQVRQRGTLDDLMFPPGEALAFISAIMRLSPGDIVSLGTPEGVGPLLDGDEVSVRLRERVEGAWMERLELTNPVRARNQA
ncbi:MAG: fumarylacetoacetate hydrolase family protein [Bradymonadia bacterium]